MNEHYITTHIAAEKYLGLSVVQVSRMCKAGVFPSAHKPGMGVTSGWRMLKSDVARHLYERHVFPKSKI